MNVKVGRVEVTEAVEAVGIGSLEIGVEVLFDINGRFVLGMSR